MSELTTNEPIAPASSTAEEKPTAPPAPGAFIAIGERQFKVCADCKEVRDRIEAFVAQRAFDHVENFYRQREDKSGREAQIALTWAEIKAGKYAYGSDAFRHERHFTDAGVKQDLFIRVNVLAPTVTLTMIEAWLGAQPVGPSETVWLPAVRVMALADGLGPK